MLAINNLFKSFGKFALTDINLHVQAEDYHILLGQSGAGKSVLLEIIAGMQFPDKGTITLNNVDITRLSAHKRRAGLVFQSPAIFPHLDVAGNIGYPLHYMSAAERRTHVFQYAEMMGIAHLLRQKSTLLSGGELQRVALARIFASKPLILLLDEPLSAIDASLRSNIRSLLRQLNRNGMPFLHVTHDFDEAVALGNKISIIDKGEIIQTGSTAEVLENPKTLFTASFSGERNIFNARLSDYSAIIKGTNGEIVFRLSERQNTDNANILIRANHISVMLLKPESSNLNSFKGLITSIHARKEGFQICVSLGIYLFVNITRESLEHLSLKEGMEVWISFKASAVEVIQ